MSKFNKVEFSALVLPTLCSLLALSPTQNKKPNKQQQQQNWNKREKTQMYEQAIQSFCATYELSIRNF